MNIAIIGPFDIENYGDHLFERILIHKLKGRYPGVCVDIFAPYEGKHGFPGDINEVYSIDSLEKMCQTKQYSAIIIGGGSTIHFRALEQVVRGSKMGYPIWKLWATASYISGKYRIKLLWNNPEVPFDFEGWESIIASNFIGAVDYLSVRDKASEKAIAALGGKQAMLGADSGFLFSDFVKEKNLNNCLPDELESINNNKPLAVFHCNNNFNSKNTQPLVDVLMNVNKTFNVLLLPLAYTNKEQITLEKIAVVSSNNLVSVRRQLSFNEICAIFTKCRLYMGLSFHGAISTYCAGGEIIAYDYEERRKTKQLYDQLDKNANYTTTIKQFKDAVEIAMHHTNDTSTTSLGAIKSRVENHFNNMFALLDDKAYVKKGLDLTALFSVLNVEMSKRQLVASEIRRLSDGYAECYRQLEELRARLGEANSALNIANAKHKDDSDQIRLLSDGYAECYRQLEELRAKQLKTERLDL